MKYTKNNLMAEWGKAAAFFYLKIIIEQQTQLDEFTLSNWHNEKDTKRHTEKKMK